MEDLYEALIGGGATPATQAALAAALRKRNQMGQLGQITGDKILASTGKGLSNSADEYAGILQQTRQNDARQQQTEAYQGGQLEHMRNTLAETKRNNDLDHKYQMLMAQAANTRADRPAGAGKIPKLRQGDIKELQDLAEGVGIVTKLEKHLADGKGFGAKLLDGTPIPGARPLANALASKGYGTKEDKAAYAMKQEWDRMYTLVTRNRLFGATLTPNEQTAWEQANPSIGQTDEQIAAALPVMRKIMKHRMDKKASGLIKEGYNAEALADYTDIPGINTAGDPSDLEGDNAPKTAPKRWVQQADGTFVQQ